MARQLKPQKVEDYRHHRRGVSISIFLDRNTHEFFFDFMKERYIRPSLAELQRVAHEVVERETSLTWIPMITVESLSPFCRNDDTFIGFTIKRSWIAKKASGRWLEGRWEDKEDGSLMGDREKWASDFYPASSTKQTDFSLPFYGDEHYYLPYTDALWTGLETLLTHVRAMKKTLTHLLTTPDGLQRVERAATKSLPGGIAGMLNKATGESK